MKKIERENIVYVGECADVCISECIYICKERLWHSVLGPPHGPTTHWQPPYGDGSAGVLATTLWDPSTSPRAVSSLPSPLTFAKDLIRGMLSGQVRGLATCGRETLARCESPVYAALLSGQVRGRLPEAGLSYCRHFLEQGNVVVYSVKA